MNKIKYFITFVFVLTAALFIGCGEDSSGPGNNTNTAPTINMKAGSFYVFNIDSISTSGAVSKTSLKTSNTYLTPGSFFGQTNVFPISSQTRDTLSGAVLATDTFYVRYDGGKFYQYGVLQLISPSFPATWDLVGDFTVSQGTSWNIATGVPITIGIITGTANITGKIAVDTTFKTDGHGEKSINCYRSEIVADILFSGFSVGKVYVDYFIGDSDPTTNPAGLVRTRLRPINLTVYSQAGVDQKIQSFIIP